MKKLFELLTIIFSLIIIGCSGAKEEIKTDAGAYGKPETKTVAVMPFEEQTTFPYVSDVIRESLMNSLLTKNTVIINDAGSWDKLSDLKFPLTSLTRDEAAEVARLLKADLIIYGYANLQNDSRRRESGLYNERIVTPIIVNVFESENKTVLLHERYDITLDDLNNRMNRDIGAMADKLVQLMADRGYISY